MTDGGGLDATYTVPVTIVDPAKLNNLPTGSLLARDVAAVNEQFVAQATATDPDEDDVAFWLLRDGQRVSDISSVAVSA